MGYIRKDNNMNVYKSSNSIHLKQGYLHIKRERSSGPVASRVLFKPWQQAYFILRRDPYVVEEYKDATLKTLRQHHYVGAVKHVGIVRTSKSQQYAFEVVVKDDIVLFFGCENQILREEWIAAFVDVMNTVSEIRKETPPSIDNSSSHAVVERKGSLNDTYRVRIVESSLANSNELSGAYFVSVTSSRMSLLSIDDLKELLSWPINHVTYYTHQPATHHIFLIMSRLCHFGSGKLIFESSQSEQLMRCIEIFHTKNRTDSPKLRSSQHHHNYSGGGSSQQRHSGGGSTSTNSIGSSSTSERSPLRLSCDEDTVFDSSQQQNDHSTKVVEDDVTSTQNTHAKLKRTEFKDNHILIASPSSPIPSENATNDPSATNEHFAEITCDDGYVLPNQPDMEEGIDATDDVTTSLELTMTSSLRDTASGSDNENEMSSSYLQIVDNEDSSEDTEAKRLLEEITTKLTDPQNTPDSSCSVLKTVNTPPSSSPPSQLKRESKRRSSEPPKSLTSQKSFEKEHQKLSKNGKKASSYSVDSSISFNSPLTPANFKKTNAFPKQHSISHGNHDSVSGKADKPSNNPFDSLGSFFMTPTTRSQKVPGSQSFNKFPIAKSNVNRLRRNYTESVLSTPIKCPELDRNTKPKAPRSKALDVDLNATPSRDEPPRVPERVSPKPFTEDINKKKQLQRSSYLDYSDQDDVTDQQPQQNERDGKTVAPPLPPKSKLLSSTRSAPIPNRRTDNIKEINSLLRSSSLGITTDVQTSHVTNGSWQISHEGSIEIIAESNADVPPEVPCRLPTHPMAKLRHLSTSEGNLLKSSFKLFNMISRDSTRSASVEQDLQNQSRIAVHEIDLQAPICDEGLLSECPVKQKPFKSISTAFPKPKKIF